MNQKPLLEDSMLDKSFSDMRFLSTKLGSDTAHSAFHAPRRAPAAETLSAFLGPKSTSDFLPVSQLLFAAGEPAETG